MTKRVLLVAALGFAAFVGITPARAATTPTPPSCKATTPRGHRLHTMCTHGGDPAPPYVDLKHRDPVTAQDATAATGATMTASTGTLPCYGDGTTGNRVEAIYAVPAGTVDRYSTVAPMIRTWALAADNVFSTSAAETGGVRHVRWVTDAQCNLVVDHVNLSSTGADTFDNTINELQNKGYTRGDRKYLVWTDANAYCGIAEVYNDDSATAANTNNGGDAMFGRVDTGCWGIAGNSVEAHELMHTLGGVQLTAPHATTFNHCWDASDVMCYADGSGSILQQLCPTTHGDEFDCNHDDYFSTAPPANSYLATHWNTANSSFLATTNGGPSWHLTGAGSPSIGLNDGLAVTSMASGRLDVFGRGTDNALWHSWYDGVWHPWENLGGALVGAPAAASWGNNRLDVFVRGTDNGLWRMWWDGVSWHGWESVGGALTSSPAAVSPSYGRVDVFVRGTDNALWTRTSGASGWGGWSTLGGVITADPAALSPAPGQLDIYVRGTDTAIWARTNPGDGWRGWGNVGGATTSAPTASSWGGGHRDVFVRGTDNAWWHRSFDWSVGAWSGWESLGTSIAGQPAAVSMTVGRLDVFGVNNGAAYDRWYG